MIKYIKMKKFYNILAIALSIVLFFSCSSSKKVSNEDKGVAIGAGTGAAAGGIIGHASGNTAMGAVIGGIVGGVAGGLIGNKMDKQQKEIEEIKEAKVEKVNNGEGLKVTFDAGILFETNSSTLSAQSQDALNKFSQSLQNNPETNVAISGHTDNTGSDKVNDPLSEKRAESVFNFLVSRGVARRRMTTVGNGSKQPVASNATEEGRAKNRRVEIVIVANDKMVNDAKQGNLK
jgi:outer membrane protein OmpA-like peptidoglycan-associated protein